MITIGELSAKITCDANEIMRAWARAADAVIRFIDLWALAKGKSSAERYALAGYRYGKNTRGKKRWLLEQSRWRRGV